MDCCLSNIVYDLSTYTILSGRLHANVSTDNQYWPFNADNSTAMLFTLEIHIAKILMIIILCRVRIFFGSFFSKWRVLVENVLHNILEFFFLQFI